MGETVLGVRAVPGEVTYPSIDELLWALIMRIQSQHGDPRGRTWKREMRSPWAQELGG